MQGLRVYINPGDAENQSAHVVFYSRRDDGPYYLWRYEGELKQWRCSRVRHLNLSPGTLSLASWKSVPVELRTSLGQHYVE